MKLLKNKNGELTTQQIVFLVILITSFVVILFFLFRLNLGGETQKEICHNSIVLKGKSVPGFGDLDCRINYLCVSGGANCEGINPTQTIKVDSNDKNEIMKAIVDEMADCWWMFGEGKVDYEGNDWDGYHCANCAILKFDEKIQEKYSELGYNDVYNFLKNPKKDSQTYLQYLYGTNSMDSVKNIIEVKQFKLDTLFSTKERYTILTGLNPNWPSDDSIISPSFVESAKVKESTMCDVFDLTKA